MNLDALAVTQKTSDNFPGLTLLNYSQIDTPKNAVEAYSCRGHIVDERGRYYCRPFDRFFNYGETQCSDFDWAGVSIAEKLDGSLIKIWHDGNNWQIGTRGTFDALSLVHGHDITFRELTVTAFGLSSEDQFQVFANGNLNEKTTYLFELTSPMNRIVVPYAETCLWLLAARNNVTGNYWDNHTLSILAKQLGVKQPAQYKFNTVTDCIEAAQKLPFDVEGYVVYKDGTPVCKIKGPAYVAVHRIRGEGLTPARICELVLLHEESEYLAYFPSDKTLIEPYAAARDKMLAEIHDYYLSIMDISEQKQFAMEATKKVYSAILFEMRKTGITANFILQSKEMTMQIKLLRAFMNTL